MASFGFGVHLQRWQWRGVQPSVAWQDPTPPISTATGAAATTTSPASSSAAKSGASSQQWQYAYGAVEGLTSKILVRSGCAPAGNGVLQYELVAIARDGNETDISSARLNLSLPSNLWEGGNVELTAKAALPAVGSKMQENGSLFTAPVQARQQTSGFVMTTRTGFSMRITVEKTPEAGSTTTNFCDIRKWSPALEIRIGELNSFSWEKDLVRRWIVRIEVLGQTALSLADLRFSLTSDMKQQLRERGFLQLSGLLPPTSVAAALKVINRGIATAEQNGKKFAQEFTANPALTSLVNSTKVRGLLESILGAAMVPECHGSQIALVFPSDNDRATPTDKLHHHIDGLPTPSNGVEKGKIHPFTLIVGVYLNETTENCGNFVVFPGTHLLHAKYFQENRPESLLGPDGYFGGKMPEIQRPPGVQIQAKAGDIVIAHYMLAHSIASNVSPFIRYAVYFRCTSKAMQAHSLESLQQPFLDWPGVQ